MDKDELIRRLIWLQLKETIDAYNDAEDLNAGYEKDNRSSAGGGRSSVRLFINLGAKDGLDTGKLIQFITESTDMESNIIDRVTVRDLSSFFNVPSSAAEFIQQVLPTKKYKGRKVRIEEAEQRDRNRGGDRPERGGDRPYGNRGSGDYKGKGSRGGSQKFNKRY
jgi:ATP-dependent RNA helicase DeaD